MSNDQLGDFNQHAAAQHAALSARFGKHVSTLNSVQADLMVVFRRISAIKKKLLQDHPELHELHQQLSAERERTLESEPPTPTPSSSSEAGVSGAAEGVSTLGVSDAADAQAT